VSHGPLPEGRANCGHICRKRLHLAPMLAKLPIAFTYATAKKLGLSDHRLRVLVATGTLGHFGHGVYRKVDAPLVDLDMVEVALRSPDATLCLLSALSRHDLTDIIPPVINIALPRSRRPPRVNAPVRWHRFHDATFELGRQRLGVDENVELAIYSPERCIVDAFRLRHLEGDEVAVDALRRWLKWPNATPAHLLDLARSFPKGEPALLTALRVLL